MSKVKKDQGLVESVLETQKDLNALTVDKINELAPEAEEVEPQLTMKEKAALENALYIEPRRKMKGFGTLAEKQKKQHAHDWEYVKGIFENYVVNGEPLRFWHCIYPEDADCLWEIPCNVAVYVPRMIAKHLEEQMKYHKFEFVPISERNQGVDRFTDEFRPVTTTYRGKFRPIGAFA